MKKNYSVSFDNLPAEKKAHLIHTISHSNDTLERKKVTAGFDGFIDTIARIIREKEGQQIPFLFNTIKEFGDYILEKQGASFSLELEERSIKSGGNMPIMANALGRLGIPVNCIGALGHPQLNTIFNQLSPNCSLYSFAEPGTATAYEFNDGKMMIAQMKAINTAGWEKIKEAIGIETLILLYSESDMICLLNWSEIDASTNIWKGILKEVLPRYSPGKNQIAFFDLSDCSKRNEQAIGEALDLLHQFAKRASVILSLNKNEADIIYQSLYSKKNDIDLFATGKAIIEKLSIHTLVLHSAKEAMAFTKNEQIGVDSFFTPEPVISTGAGDNFNAGFCTGQLLELDLELSLVFANAVSGYYIRKGESPGLTDIIHFLNNSLTPN
jgi:sugar/nucleoside kinase (ribokinase family)